ncbi:MAG: winged helix-turn-helix transcriptional regulator [Lentisphaerae bacterium]|nr:winged helix-turn-helix transcriptional regulator [Lentisphaerota bacterium]
MKAYLAITKALSDPNRVRMLCALRDGELCVCQLIELLGLAPSTVSKHLSVLNHAELIESRKEGRWVYYRLPRKRGLDVAARMTNETFRALADSNAISADDRRLKAIREANVEELCRKT